MPFRIARGIVRPPWVGWVPTAAASVQESRFLPSSSSCSAFLLIMSACAGSVRCRGRGGAEPAAVDEDVVPGDVRGVVAGREQGGVAVGLPGASEQDSSTTGRHTIPPRALPLPGRTCQARRPPRWWRVLRHHAGSHPGCHPPHFPPDNRGLPGHVHGDEHGHRTE